MTILRHHFECFIVCSSQLVFKVSIGYSCARFLCELATISYKSGRGIFLQRPKSKRWPVVTSLTLAIIFMVASGFLGYQVVRSWRQVDVIRKQLNQVQQSLNVANAVDSQEKDPVCVTKECVRSASVLLEAMDTSVDPCQDFYQFSCGNWLRKNNVPETNLNQFTVLRERGTLLLKDVLSEPGSTDDSEPVSNSRKMYRACMDSNTIESAGLSPLIQLLNAYGGWPMAMSDWAADKFNWRQVSTSIRRDLGESSLFEVYNYLDWKDTNKSVIYIDQAALGLSYSTLINAKSNSTAPIIQAYTSYAFEAAKAILEARKEVFNDSIVLAEVEEMITFEIALAKIQTKPEERRNRTRMYNPMQLDFLQRWTDEVNLTSSGQVNWMEYINSIYSVVNISVPENETVVVIEPEFIRKVFLLLENTSPRVLANYMLWRLVLKTGGHTNQLMNSISFKFSKVLYGTFYPQPRWRMCVNSVSNTLGFAVSSLYIERAFDEQAKREVLDMIGHLKSAFNDLVKESQWMDADTKVRALEKAAAMKEFIAYPDWIRNKTALTAYYKGIDTMGNVHYENYINVIQFLERSELKGLRLPTDRSTWATFPSVVNAYHYYFYNAITFPAGILQPPFFGKGRLAALNYGGIGMVIGHEITHGFDDRGRQTDKDGRVSMWWSNQTLDRYLTAARCFVEQYGNYTFPEFAGSEAFRINGIISQGENIADNGGIREAFRAYQNYVLKNGREPRLVGLEEYTPEQLFFISYANVWCGKQTPQSLKQQILNGPHTPERFRVIGPLSNSVDFARHFKCPQNSPMNNVNKCILW